MKKSFDALILLILIITVMTREILQEFLLGLLANHLASPVITNTLYATQIFQHFNILILIAVLTSFPPFFFFFFTIQSV